MHKKLVVILGPTASGKTSLSLKLAEKLNGEIVSADSRQIYRELDIGTAKPDKKQLKQIKHYLINIKNPNQHYTVAQYKREAIKAINKIIKSGKVPFLVGGTGLYIKSLTDNLEIPEVKPDWKLRDKLESEIKNKGLKNVYNKLIKLDPEAAYIIDKNNPRRVVRALEIAIKTKKPFSQQRKKGKPLFDILEIGLNPGEKKLIKIINKRVDRMIETGLLKEVKRLIKKYNKKLHTFDAIGYREIIDCLDNKISLKEAAERIKKNTWHFAKRQMTWFKKPAVPTQDDQIHWVKNQKEAGRLISEFLSSR